MSDIAVRVENLAKRYRIGGPRASYKTLRETVAAAATAPARRFRGLPPRHDEMIWALKDLSFEVKQGEAIGIIGRNGAGKSTLLKVLSRITRPTKGRAEIHGRVGSLLEVGTGFHPELTGRENIYLNGAILGMRKAEISQKFDQIVAFAEIEKFLDTPVKHYSSGMYMRLAFAVAAHLDPEILLVDEVLAVGDATFQKKCLGKMGDVTKQGRTVLFVSHNLVALRSLCPRAIWLDHGELRKEGASSEIVSAYLETGATNVSEQTWSDPTKAPGDGVVRVLRVWAKPDTDSQDGIITRESPVLIGVDYMQLVPTNIHVTLHVYVEQQVVAFTTASCHGPDWRSQTGRKGLFRSTCKIPAHFLNTGQHRVNLLIVQDQSRLRFEVQDALSFQVVEVEERRGAWFGKEPGVLRPQLAWSTQYLSG